MSKPSVPAVKLNNGLTIPQVGLGTWLSQPNEVADAVRLSLDLGYTHIDCAVVYENEKEIGVVFGEYLKTGKVKREDLFVTSKIWCADHSFAACTAQIDDILADLQLEYLDLLEMHWPMGYKEGVGRWPRDADGKVLYSDVDWLETYQAMEAAVKAGKVRSLGVCNFNSIQMERLLKEAKIKPVMLQTECHPYLPQRALLEWCKQHDLAVTCYSPLANPTHRDRKEGMPMLLKEPLMKEIGDKYGKSPAQVVIRWHIERGCVVIPKSTIAPELTQNIDVFDFKLTADDMAKIAGLENGLRLNQREWDADAPYFPWGQSGAIF